MSILGEAILTESVKLLLNKLASSEMLSFARQEHIDTDLKKWENILMKIYVVLEDAEEKHMTNQFVKKWLVDLKNVVSDVEDILYAFSTKASNRKLSSKLESSTSKVCMLIPTCSTSFNPRFVKSNVKMGSEIKKITDRLQEIVAQKNNLQLLNSSEGRSSKVRDQRLPITSLTEAPVHGREKDQEAIIELLLKDDGNEENVSVIPIVGIAEVGKVTLAENVYNDDRVKSHFYLRAWACISRDFDVVNVTRTILHSVSSICGDSSDLNQLQVKLNERLANKKFCIVLDDIWNENYDKWTVFLRPFRVGSTGSKIIVTTRSLYVARSEYISSIVSTLPTYRFKTEKDDNNGGGGDDDNNGGGDDGDNGSGGGKNEKKDDSVCNGNSNNDRGEGSGNGSGKNGNLKQKQMKPMFGCKFGYHAVNENWCLLGQ